VLCSCETINPFRLEHFKEYRTTSDFSKFMTVAKQYETKYKDELGSYALSPLQSDSYDDALDEIRTVIQTLYAVLKDIDPDDAPSHK
jgi:hypothetical protein